jgi:uncharacterized protein with NAD-binding domain and iron-sulfur cluster
MTERPAQNLRVAVVGGGLAGLAAGCALAGSGFRVTLLERRSYLGGRASSYQHPGTGEVVDNCQHVLLGCCTNLIQFYERLGVENKIRWYERLTFLEPGGRASVIEPSRLPAPFHNAPAFLRAACLDLSDKLTIGMAMAALAPATPRDDGETFLAWLRRHAQTKPAIERFWKPVLVSALNEDLDRMSVPYAAQVVRESFMKSAAAGRMGVPTVPLTELYSVAGDYITTHGGEIRFRCSVESVLTEPDHVTLLVSGEEASFEWMFHKSKLLGRNANGSYVELVVSSSKALVEKSKAEIIELALAELREFFPAARDAKLVKSTVIKEMHATYSPRPGVDVYRPRPETVWPRVFLAGDWTATGWPATMEGAVRSGYVAAESVARLAGVGNPSFLVPDLSASGFMRLFG